MIFLKNSFAVISIVSVYCCAIRLFEAVAFCRRTKTSRSNRFIAIQYGIWTSQSSGRSGNGSIRYSRHNPELISKSLTNANTHSNSHSELFPSSGLPSIGGSDFLLSLIHI